MHLDEFRDKYVRNEHREILWEAFLRDLAIVKRHLDPYRVVVYGSFVTDKDQPNDIDALYAGNLRADAWVVPLPFEEKERVHWKNASLNLPGPSLPPLPTAGEMVAAFNEANDGITAWVELEPA